MREGTQNVRTPQILKDIAYARIAFAAGIGAVKGGAVEYRRQRADLKNTVEGGVLRREYEIARRVNYRSVLTEGGKRAGEEALEDVKKNGLKKSKRPHVVSGEFYPSRMTFAAAI